MPIPVSDTERLTTSRPAGAPCNVIDPRSVNFTAFTSRFETICFSRSGSAHTRAHAGSSSASNVTPWPASNTSMRLRMSVNSGARSTVAVSIFKRPASIRDRSMRSLIRCDKLLAFLVMRCRMSRCAGSSDPDEWSSNRST